MGGGEGRGGRGRSAESVSVLPPSLNSLNALRSPLTQLVSSWAWIREYSRRPLKGSRGRLLLLSKQSSKTLRRLEVKHRGRCVVVLMVESVRTDLKNCGGFHRSMRCAAVGTKGQAEGRERERAGRTSAKEREQQKHA